MVEFAPGCRLTTGTGSEMAGIGDKARACLKRAKKLASLPRIVAKSVSSATHAEGEIYDSNMPIDSSDPFVASWHQQFTPD